MKGLNRFTLTLRRQSFIKTIRTEQREQFKSQKREKLLQEIDAYSRLWRIKQIVPSLALPNQIAEALEIVNFFKQHSHSLQFCQHLKSTSVLEDFIQHTIACLLRDPKLQIQLLMEKIFDLVYFLLAKSNIFLALIEQKFNLLLIGLDRYAGNKAIFQRACQFCVCAEMFINERWIENYRKIKLVSQHQIISKLAGIYVFDSEYMQREGQALRQVMKHSSDWLMNAVKCLQIVYTLIRIDFTSSDFSLNQQLKQGLYNEIKLILEEQRLKIESMPCIPIEQDLMADMDEVSATNECTGCQKSIIYFISLIVDIVVIEESLLEQNELQILRSLLEQLLDKLGINKMIGMIALKIIKIFYEQIVLTEDDLRQLALTYQDLAQPIQAILQNDMI